MKVEKIVITLKKHFKENLYIRITRGFKKDFSELSKGYLIDLSSDFVLLKELDDFIIDGYNIIPINRIKNLRYNENDKYFDFISKSEFSLEELVSKDFDVNLNSWESIFKSLKSLDKTIISECEKYKHNYFAIGKINKVKEDSVLIDYFNAQGVLDAKPVEHKFKWITKVTFDDDYSKVFSKYIKC